MSQIKTEIELSSPVSSSSSSCDLSPKTDDDKSTYKKSNKPLMEKKRRARINSCLTQLKSLVLQAMKKDKSQYSKLEKADILELTVRHLKNVQRYHGSSMTQFPDAMSKYRAGFNECANEVFRYLGESKGVNDEARTRIISHLASMLSPINSLPLQQAHTPILPAPLQQLQQQHLQPQQQLHLQQQQNQNVFLTQSSQPLSTDTGNTKSIISYSTFLSSAGNTSNINHSLSSSPTAFQSPVTTGVNVATGLLLPCIATTAMATTTQLQLVPSTLPPGHLALVIAPQNIPTMNVYAAHQGSRPQAGKDAIQPHIVTQLEDCRTRVAITDRPVPSTKQSLSQRQDTIVSAGSYQRSSSSHPARTSIDYPPTVFLMTSSSSAQLSNLNMKQSNILRPSSASNVIANAASTRGSINSTTNNCGMSVVRTTSTWRPW